MSSRFAKRREAALDSREKGINQSTPNPARAVERASLTAVPGSSEDAAIAPTVDIQEETSASLVTRTEKRKKRKTVGSGPQGKRSLEESEVEVPRKRPAHESRLSAVEEEEGSLAIVRRTSSSSRGPGSPSRYAPTFRWTKDGFRLPKDKRELLQLSREIQEATPPLKNLRISDPIIGKYFGGAVLSRGMDSDTFDRAKSRSSGIEDSLGHIGALFSQVYILALFEGC